MTTETTTHPGPWTYHIGQDYTTFYDAKDDEIMTVRHAMEEAIAAKIAAAPDLLEACKMAANREGDWMAACDAAIAKATG